MKVKSLGHINKQTLYFILSITFERIGFYGVRSLLVLHLISSPFEMSNSESMSIYGWFTSLLVFAKIVGGLSGDFIIGNKKSIILGSFLQALGAFLLCIPSIYGLYSGLFFVVLRSEERRVGKECRYWWWAYHYK